MGKQVYHFKGGAGVEDKVYSSKTAKGLKLAKDSRKEPFTIKVSANELKLMKAYADVVNSTSPEQIIRAFLSKAIKEW